MTYLLGASCKVRGKKQETELTEREEELLFRIRIIGMEKN
jgi:hypothetical protein